MSAPSATGWAGSVDSVLDLSDRLAAVHALDDAGRPIPRASVLTLVAFPAGAAGDADETEALIDAMCGHQPSRTLIVDRDPTGDGIDAQVETRSRNVDGSHLASTVELVRLTLRGASAAGAASAVRALVRPDLPVFVWWPRPPDLGDPLLRAVVDDADRLITESGRHPDAAAAIRRLAGAVDAGPALTDLAWAAITPWRQIISQVVDAAHVERMRQGGTVEVWHPGETPTVEALLVGGWLRAGIGGNVRVAMHARPAPVPGGVSAVRIARDAGKRLTIERFPDRDMAMVAVRPSDGPTRQRVLPLPCRDRSELLAGELELQSPDRPFERALPHALELGTR